ncbi:MAG: recombinase family protein [Clostridiales bacterium]|nr:recombinase family protein [Clostridiales bacterium]
MNDQVLNKESKNRAILYCRSSKGDNSELQEQNDILDCYVKTNGLAVVRTYMESGTMGALTYKNLRLQAKYHEFDELLIMELAVLGNSSIEITEEIGFLVENGTKVLSIKDGELNVNTLSRLFRNRLRPNK